MSTTTSVNGLLSSGVSVSLKHALTLLETLLVFAGILLYIWRWQFAHPHAWVFLWAVVLASHIAHRDTLRDLGLTGFQLRACAELALPLALAIYTALLFYGFARHSLVMMAPIKQSFALFVSYGFWCAIQQYLVQSYF